jgi:uncharacterized membrane-anchored protein YitT (DUF2179 family)
MGPILDLEIVGGVLVALGASHLVLPESSIGGTDLRRSDRSTEK